MLTWREEQLGAVSLFTVVTPPAATLGQLVLTVKSRIQASDQHVRSGWRQTWALATARSWAYGACAKPGALGTLRAALENFLNEEDHWHLYLICQKLSPFLEGCLVPGLLPHLGAQRLALEALSVLHKKILACLSSDNLGGGNGHKP